MPRTPAYSTASSRGQFKVAPAPDAPGRTLRPRPWMQWISTPAGGRRF